MKNIEIRILSSFFPLEKEYTTKEIEEGSGYSHERVYTTLLNLAKENYLIKRKIGRTYLFKLNFSKDLVLSYMFFQTKRKEEFYRKTSLSVQKLIGEFIEKIKNEDLISVIIYGSYARSEQKENSDIDMLCVIRKRRNIDNITFSLKHKYGKKISPIIILSKDFKNIKKDNIVFFNGLVEDGIVLFGSEYFFKAVYEK